MWGVLLPRVSSLTWRIICEMPIVNSGRDIPEIHHKSVRASGSAALQKAPLGLFHAEYQWNHHQCPYHRLGKDDAHVAYDGGQQESD